MTHKYKLTLEEFIKVNDKKLEVLTKQLNKTPEKIFNDSIKYKLVYELTSIIQSEPFSVKQCEDNYNYIYVFEDNTIRQGKDNSAIIRDCANSFGIVTKRFPNNLLGSYLDNQDIDLIKSDLEKLLQLYQSGKTIVFPTNGLGTGQTKLNETAPNLFNYLKNFIGHNFLMYEEYTK